MAGLDCYMCCGNFLKTNGVELTKRNFLQRIVAFRRVTEIRGHNIPLDSNCGGELLRLMVQSKKYFPFAGWVWPCTRDGPKKDRALACGGTNLFSKKNK